MFGKKKKTLKEKIDYDRDTQRPVLRCSICNGEKVAGFKDIKSGSFQEVMYIRSDADLKTFMEACGISEIVKEY